MKIQTKDYHFLNKFKKSINLDWSIPGIYIIQGSNGSGKTTFIEDLLFYDKINVEFENTEFLKQYNNDRYNLISYLPQDLPEPFITVKDLFTKVEVIEPHLLPNILSDLGLDDTILKKRIEQLSGGERVKIFFIATLMRKTPYIFLDEPTNNLDDDTVSAMLNYLNESAKNSIVIIATHDPRIISTSNSLTVVSNASIIYKDNSFNSSATSVKNPTELKFSSTRFILNLFTAPHYFSLILFQFLAFGTLLFLSDQHLVLNSNFLAPPEPGAMIINSGFLGGNVFNSDVAHSLGLTLDEVDDIFTWSDIPNIYALPGVQNIVITDPQTIQIFRESIDILLDVEQIVNPPQSLWYGLDLWHPFLTPRDLREGRFPSNESREVTISPANLQAFHGFTAEESLNSIGSFITVNEILHEIVGLLYTNITIVSHHPNENFGFVSYDPISFNSFSENTIAYLESLNWWNPLAIEAIHIEIDADYEENLLRELIVQFPEAEFYSYQFANAWILNQEWRLNRQMFHRNLFMVIPTALLLGFLFSASFSVSLQEIKVHEIKYLDKRTIRKSALLAISFSTLAAVFFTFLLGIILFEHLNRIFNTLLVNTSIFLILNYAVFKIVEGKDKQVNR